MNMKTVSETMILALDTLLETMIRALDTELYSSFCTSLVIYLISLIPNNLNCKKYK